MARDRNFQRKQKDARMPARDSHGEDRMAARQGEPDYDLRRARDAPSSGTSRNRRQAAPVQTETYGSDIFAGCENSDTAAIPLFRFFPDRNQPDQSHTHRKPGQRIPGGAARHRAMPFSGIPGRRNPDRRISVRGAQGGAMLLTRISSRKNPDKQISARRAQGGAMPLTRISGRKNPHRRIPDRKIPDGQLLQNTVRKVRIPGMGNYFRKEPGHRKGKKNPARQDTGTGHGSMVINTNSAFRRRQKPGNLRRNRRRQPKENQNGLPSWNLPLTNSHRKQRIRSSRKPDGRQNGQRKNWNRRKTAFLPAVSCGWKHLLIPIRARPKSA